MYCLTCVMKMDKFAQLLSVNGSQESAIEISLAIVFMVVLTHIFTCNKVDDALLGPRELRHHASRRRITNMERHLPGLRFARHEFKSQYITTTRGTEVHVETWYPTTVAQPRGVIYVCHGYADSARWMQRYVHSFYLNQGFAVCAVEYEGHGYSSGYFVYIHDFNGIVDDCDECFQQVHQVFEKRSGASLRRFVSGESMGGGVALCLAMKHKNLWDGLVLCAPMCRIADHVKPSAPMISLLTTIAPLIPKLTVVPSKIGPDIIYKDLNKRMLSVSNPFRFHSVPRLRSAISLLHATEYIDANMEKVTTPILILHGSDDKVTDPVCSKTLYKRVQSKDKTFNLYPGVWHAFLGEPSETSSKIYSDIAAWLDRQAPVLQ